MLTAFPGMEILKVCAVGHGQHGDEFGSGVQSFVRHQTIAAFGERREHHQRQIGELPPQLRQQRLHLRAQGFDFRSHQIAMAGDADDQGSGIDQIVHLVAPYRARIECDHGAGIFIGSAPASGNP